MTDYIKQAEKFLKDTNTTVEEREKRLCKKYCELNPQHKERRERDKDIYLLALYAARQEIKKMTNIK